METAVTRDAKGKIRVIQLTLTWNDTIHAFRIGRTTFQLGGKHTKQPDIFVERGKANRTVKEQALLEYNSNKNKYLDKGYKLLTKPLEEYSEEELQELIGEFVTDTNGFSKHMCAKRIAECKDSSIEKVKEWYISRKIDGVRCSFYYKDGKIKTASRGGKVYDDSTYQIREHPDFIQLFKNHPDLILDGELYKHGKSLQQISGAARMEKNVSGCDWIEYYIYDVMIPNKPFSERLQILKEIQKELNIGFFPDKDWQEGELRVNIVPQILIKGENKIKQMWELHDKYVLEGWEGCVARNASKNYKFGGRGQEMIKFKNYQDDEFEITGLSEGLREEDMCFTLKTKDGIEFKAKPMGSRELKRQYRNDLQQLIGKMATVKYFTLSDEGTPLQPTLKAIRDYE